MMKDKTETIRAARLCTVKNDGSSCRCCPYVKNEDGTYNNFCQRELIRDLEQYMTIEDYRKDSEFHGNHRAARILSMEEVETLADSFFEAFVWVELYTPKEKRMCLCYCKIDRCQYAGGFVLKEDSGQCWIRDAGCYNNGSGKWRCWTERPTFEDRMKADRETVKLMPCPFCGADAAKISTAMQLEECAMFAEKDCPARTAADTDDCGYKTVVCDVNKGGCGAASGFMPTEEEAVRAWNRRGGKADDKTGTGI